MLVLLLWIRNMSELMMICRLSYFLTEFLRELFRMNEQCVRC